MREWARAVRRAGESAREWAREQAAPALLGTYALLGLERGERSLAALADDLGYADQAHFSRDFRALVGISPAAYAARARGG